ncbi:MAG: cytidylate kinase family protein [Bryobacteraceae bacterium]
MAAAGTTTDSSRKCSVRVDCTDTPTLPSSREVSTVLLISRGTMSGAARIAGCLSQVAGVRSVSREDLLAAVNSYGELATRIAAQIVRADREYQRFSDLRRPYQILMRRALLQYARHGCLAYFGYSGHLLLPRIAHFVRIRLIAPMAMRIARTREVLGQTEAEARDYIRQADTERVQWARMMYGVDLRDPAEYDLCVNLERWSLPGACELLARIMAQQDFQPTPESVTQMDNECLSTEVLAALVTNPDTHTWEIGASASAGAVRLVGPFLTGDEMRVVSAVAGSVPGVREVAYEPGYAPAFC